MQFSQLFFDIRIQFECSGNLSNFLIAYQDPGGVWTIGIGTTIYPDGSRVAPGDTCTAQQAIDYAQAATAQLQAQLVPTLPGAITQAQFDAIGDFAYNEGPVAWSSSTLRKTINASHNNFTTITADFEMWDKAHVDGQLVTLPGLLRRRKCEAYLYQNGVNHPTFFASDPTLA